MLLLRNKEQLWNNPTCAGKFRNCASAGKVADMIELKLTTEQWIWLLCSVSVIMANKLSLHELKQLIGIKLLTLGFLEIFVLSPNFQGRANARFGRPW